MLLYNISRICFFSSKFVSSFPCWTRMDDD